MKVYLINMPFSEQEYTKFSEKWDYIEDEYIGINIIYALLLRLGVQVEKSNRTKIDDMIADVFDGQYNTVMISAMQTSASLSYKFIMRIREEGYSGTIFVGGWYPKLAWRYIFEHKWPVDYVCYVDAEDVFPKWVSIPHSFIPGIATYDNYKQQIALSPDDIRSYNTWPESYCSPIREPGRKTYRLETSRGCPHAHCTFCSLSCADVIKDKWRPLSREIILISIKNVFYQFALSNAHDGITRKVVDCLAETVYHLFQCSKYLIAKPSGSQFTPDLLNRIHFRSVWRYMQDRHSFRNFQRSGFMPRRTVTDKNYDIIWER